MKIKETDPRFIFLRGKILIFLITAILGALIFLYFAGKERGFLIKKKDFYCLTSKATGLYVGMPVRISGFKIGRLKKMELQEDGFVKLTLSIEESHSKWFKDGTVAVFSKEGFIGESYIEILPGKGQPLKPGQTIKFFRQAGIEEIAGELKEEISEILKGVKETINYLNAPEGNIKKSINNIEMISHNLIETTNQLNALLFELNKKIPHIADNSDKTLEEIRELVRLLQNLSKELYDTATAIKGLTKKDMPFIIEQTKKSMQDIDEILQSVKGIWPIREGIKKKEIRPVEVDTYDK